MTAAPGVAALPAGCAGAANTRPPAGGRHAPRGRGPVRWRPRVTSPIEGADHVDTTAEDLTRARERFLGRLA